MKWLFLTRWTCFVIFQSFQQKKKNHPPLRLEESHSEDFCTYKRWSADFAWSAPPHHLLKLQRPTHKKQNGEKKRKKKKEKTPQHQTKQQQQITGHVCS